MTASSTPERRGGAVIVGGARTPFGKLLGQLGGVRAVDLGATAIRGALDRAGIDGADVDYVILGQVLQAGAGQGPARQAAVAAGLSMAVPAVAINKLCLSGLDAIALAATLVEAGVHDVIVAGGQESMSQAPHLLPTGRTGVKYGDATLKDHADYDGLWDAFTDQAMGGLTDEANAGDQHFSRADQDDFAVASHRRAAAAWARGAFADEVVPVAVPQRRGEPVLVTHDEGIRPEADAESLARLRPAFRPDGTITAGNASPISDGAAAVIVTTREVAEQRGYPILAEIVTSATVAGPDSTLQQQPARAIARALDRAGLAAGDLDLVEINEAFAQVGLASERSLGIDHAIVNVDGGAIALGHPIGASGARLALHLVTALRERGGGLGAAALCGGGGQGDAMLLRVPAPAA